MRVKISITLPKELLDRLDHLDKNRSQLIERAALAYLAQPEREQSNTRDLGIIKRNAKRLNRQALETLQYQKVR